MCVLVVKSVQRWVSVVFLVFRTHGLWTIRWTAHQNDLKSPFTSESNIVLKVGVWYGIQFCLKIYVFFSWSTFNQFNLV